MVELTSSRQVQRHSDAGRQLVSILQNFSRLQEKSKTQEEEIEQWKQSLTYQSQELNRREMELESRQEQLQQLEEDLARLDNQRQEIEAKQAEAEQLRQDYEKRSEALESAWDQLRGEMNRFEERKSEYQSAATLDEAQAALIQDLLNRLSGAIAPTEAVRDQLNASFTILSQQQDSFNQYWQTQDQQRNQAQSLQNEVDRQAQETQSLWQGWHDQQSALERLQVELSVQQNALALKQERVQTVSSQLQLQDELYQNLSQLSAQTGRIPVGAKVDVEALNKMPLDELQQTVRDLEQDLQKMSQFVSSQEEELVLQKQAMDDLQQQLQSANDYDRLRLETELADERESYEMLNQTLVGQRRNLQEREEVLKRHQAILARRQGHPVEESRTVEVDLDPALERVMALKQQLTQELRSLESDIQQLQPSVEQLQSRVNQQQSEQSGKLQEVKQMEQQWKEQRVAAAELWGKLAVYQEILQPTQDNLDGLREKVEATLALMGQFQEASDYQLQAIAEMRQVISNLTSSPTPEFVS